MTHLLLLGALVTATALPATSVPGAVTVTVSGRVVDAESGYPLEYATVSALAADGALADGALVDGASADSLGRWSLVLPKGDYRLRFGFIGYVGLDTAVTAGEDVDLGDVRLRADALALEGATVTAARSRLSLKLDKQVFDVGVDLVSRGGSANEVLDAVPLVSVSPEGAVSLRGNPSVTVLIDGKPSALADNNALQSIPAEDVARVEVITAPSSRYEAAGSGGVINVVLKSGAARRSGGRVSASVGIPADYRLNGSFSVSRPPRTGSTQGITAFGNGGLRRSRYFSTRTSARTSRLATGTEVLREDFEQTREVFAWNGFGGVEWRPSGKTALGLAYSIYDVDNDEDTRVRYRFINGGGRLERLLRQELRYLEPGRTEQLEATWTQTLPGEGQALRVLFQHDRWTYDEQARMRFRDEAPQARERPRLNTRNVESSGDYLLQGDYERPVGEAGKFEAGFRAETRLISSDYLAEEVRGGTAEVFRGLDNVMDYTERIGAAYGQYAYEGETWGVQLGLRNEYTLIRVADRIGTPAIGKRYNRLFPSATVSYRVTTGLGASIHYARRLRRPSYWYLNPFGGLDNPNEIDVGNPDMDPSFTDQVELKLLYRGDRLTVNPYAYAARVLGYFDTYVRQDPDGTVYATPVNLERERRLGLGLVATYAPSDDWELTAEGTFGYREQRGSYLGVDFGNDFRTARAQISARGTVWWGLRVQAQFDYVGPQRYAQSFREGFVDLDLGLSRALLADRLTVTANLRNAFGLQVFRGGATGDTFASSYRRVWQGQRLRLTAAWALGQASDVRRARGSIR